MSIDIHLAKDREELAAARQAIAAALMSCKGFAPALSDTAADAVMKAMFSHFGGVRVYFPGGKGRSLPADQLSEIELRLLKGEACADIAADLKVTRMTVHRIRKRMSENAALAAAMGDEK